MRARFTPSFKIQAVGKALRCPEGTSVRMVAETLGVGYSTLNRWITKSRNQEFGTVLNNEELAKTTWMTKERRPQDWDLKERLDMVIACASLEEGKLSELCRERGIYPHHVQQWRLDFAHGEAVSARTRISAEVKTLRQENKELTRELIRKDKALAETAALLVLQKKVTAIWGNEDNSR